MTTITRQLRWFSKHEGSDTVSLRVRTTVTVDGTTVLETETDQYGSDAALLAAASAAAKTTWDEEVICSVYSLTRG